MDFNRKERLIMKTAKDVLKAIKDNDVKVRRSSFHRSRAANGST